MPQAYRGEDGTLKGTLDYGGGGHVQIVEHIVPVLLPCVKCQALTFHLLGSEHAGLGVRLPFLGTVASTHKRYGLLCNKCTVLSGVYGYDLLQKLESRVLPAYVCEVLDRFLSAAPNAPLGYSREFPAFMCKVNPIYSEGVAWLAAYKRYDGR
jgi:hypothetical protein